jgi:hypothetical protein
MISYDVIHAASLLHFSGSFIRAYGTIPGNKVSLPVPHVTFPGIRIRALSPSAFLRVAFLPGL